ncbi:hypothetical protein QE152_g11066 [Popillia japonica]|uniref:Uncharacterized protein n=1 Tax=Popillia japonica TaxID=7064 RepID=A0AAW1LSJ5_POPJA
MSVDNRAFPFHRFQFTFPIEYSAVVGRRVTLPWSPVRCNGNVLANRRRRTDKRKNLVEAPLLERSSIRQDGAMGARFRGLQETQFVHLLCGTNSQFYRDATVQFLSRLRMPKMKNRSTTITWTFFAIDEENWSAELRKESSTISFSFEN